MKSHLEDLERRRLMSVDLVPVISIQPAGTYSEGMALRLGFAINNVGKSDAPLNTAIEFSVILSRSKHLSGKVKIFHAFYRGPAFSNEPVQFTTAYDLWDDDEPCIPVGLTNGKYYVGVRVNDPNSSLDVVPESDASNNLVWAPKAFSVQSASRFLTINGTEGPDTIAAEQVGLGYAVVFNSSVTLYGEWPFINVKFKGNGGDDKLFVSKFIPKSTEVTLLGNAGNDRLSGHGEVLGGTGNDLIVGDGLIGSDLFGDKGNDKIYGQLGDTVNGSFDLDRLYGVGCVFVDAKNDFVNGIRKG